MKRVIGAVCAFFLCITLCACTALESKLDIVVKLGNTVPGLSVMTVQWLADGKQIGKTNIELGNGGEVSPGPFIIRLHKDDFPGDVFVEELTMLVRVSKDGEDMFDAAQITLPARFAEQYYYVLTYSSGTYYLEKIK